MLVLSKHEKNKDSHILELLLKSSTQLDMKWLHAKPIPAWSNYKSRVNVTTAAFFITTDTNLQEQRKENRKKDNTDKKKIKIKIRNQKRHSSILR